MQSSPDWSAPPPGTANLLRDLRRNFIEFLLNKQVPRQLADCRTGCARVHPLLSAAEVDTLRQVTSDWTVQQGAPGGVDWSVPDGQPYCLHALAAFGAAVGDKDVALWPALLRGVPIGFDNDIPASNVFAPCCVPPSDEDLQICFGNPLCWQNWFKKSWQQGTSRRFPALRMLRSAEIS